MKKLFATVALVALMGTGAAFAEDFGAMVDAMLAEKSPALFGIGAPLAASAPESAEEGYRVGGRTAADSVALAKGLSAEFLTMDAAHHTDMMAFYPAEAPTHLIVCNEGDAEEVAGGRCARVAEAPPRCAAHCVGRWQGGNHCARHLVL